MTDPHFDDIPSKLRGRLKFGPPTQKKSDKLEVLTGIVSVKPGLNSVELPIPAVANLLIQAQVLPSQRSTPAPTSRIFLQETRLQALEQKLDIKSEGKLEVALEGALTDHPSTSSVATGPSPPAAPIPNVTPWHIYNEKANKEDKAMQRNLNESMDVILIFAGLFSATSTAFLQFTLPLLRKEANDDTDHLLLNILHKLENSSYPLSPPPTFNPGVTAISINCLIFASVAGSLVAAFFALSIKQWTRSYSSGLENIVTPQLLARHRQFRIEGVRKWHLVGISRILPMVLHISLALFVIGVAEYLLYTGGIELAAVVVIIGGLTTLVHLFLSLTPLLYPQAPFQSPITTILYGLWSRAQSYFRRLYSQLFHKDDTDTLDHALGKETSISRLIHVSKHLDIGVLIGLMKNADRHTEEWILDLCMSEIMNLRHIPNEIYQLFYHETIVDTYSYLITTCLYSSGESRSIAPGTEHRARTLCRFVTWFASIYSKQIPVPLLSKPYTVGSSTDTTALGKALYEYGTAQGSLCDLVHGFLACVASAHLCDLPKAKKCIYCVDSHDDRSKSVLEFLLNYETESRDLVKRFEEGQSVIDYIASQTRCAFHSDNPQYPSSEATQQLQTLINKYDLSNPMFSGEWEFWKLDVLSFPSSKDSWVDILQSVFETMAYQKGEAQSSSHVIKSLSPVIVGDYTRWPPRRAPPVVRSPVIVSPTQVMSQRRPPRPHLSQKPLSPRPTAMAAPSTSSPPPSPVIVQSPRSRSPTRQPSSHSLLRLIQVGSRAVKGLEENLAPYIPSSRSHSPVRNVGNGGEILSPIPIIVREPRQGRSYSPTSKGLSRKSRSWSPIITNGGSIVHERSIPELEIPRITSRHHSRRTEVLEIRGRSLSRSPILGSERTRSPSPLTIERRRPRSASPELQHTRPPVAVKRPKGPRPRASSSPTRVSEYRYHFHRPLADRSPERGTGQVNHIRRSSSPRDRHWYRRGTRLRSSSPQYDNRSRSHSPPRYSRRTRSHSRSPRYQSRTRSPSRSSRHRGRSQSRKRSRSHHLTRVSTTSSKQQRQDITPPPRDGPPAVHTISESPPPIRAASSAPSANLLSAYPTGTPSVPSTSGMTRDHPVLATVYCDVYIASTQVQTTAVRIHPDSSMILTGSSTEGRGVDESTEFMVDTGPAGVIETQADDSLAPCLFYAMSNHKENYEQPRFLSLNSSNAVLLPRSKFWEQLTTELCQLGVGPQIINSFIDSHYENLQHFPHVAYRFLSCRESARMVRLTVGLAECIFNSLCILVQGVSESEARVEEWTTQEPRSFDWAGIVELQDNFYDTQRNRVLELAMIYRSIPQPSVEQTPIRNTNPDLEMETQIRSVGAEGKVPVVER